MMPKYLVNTRLTFPSKIGFFFLKANAEIAPAVERPIPGKLKVYRMMMGIYHHNFLKFL
jgi:hypothetical protein